MSRQEMIYELINQLQQSDCNGNPSMQGIVKIIAQILEELNAITPD